LAIKRNRGAVNTSRVEIEVMRLDNDNKVLSNTEEEYLQLATRLGQVADTQYMKDLKEKILVLDLKIKKAERANKLLESEKMKIEWKFDKILETNESQITYNLNQLKNEDIHISRKLKEIDAALAKKNTNDTDLGAKTEKLKIRLKKLMQVAEKEGININGMEVNKEKEKDAKLEEKRKALLKKKEALRRNIRAIKNKHAVAAGDYIKKASDVKKKITPLTETIKTKEE